LSRLRRFISADAFKKLLFSGAGLALYASLIAIGCMSFTGCATLEHKHQGVNEAQDTGDIRHIPPSKSYQYYLEAKALEQDGEFSKAIDLMRLAIAQDDTSSKLKLDLAILLVTENKLDEAKRQLLKAIKLEPSFVEPISLLGEIAFFNNEFDQAVVQLKKVLLFDPKNHSAIKRLGDIIFMLHGPNATIEFFNKQLANDPYNLYALSRLVILYQMNRQAEKMQQTLIQLLGFDPEEGAVLDDLIRWYIQSHNIEIGIKLLLEIKDQIPPTSLIPLKLGKLYLAINDLEKAAKAFEEAVSYDIWDNRIASDSGFSYLEQGFPLKAAEVFRKLAEPDNNGYSIFLWAHSLLVAKQYEQAIELFEKLSPNDYFYLLAKSEQALCLWELKKQQEADEQISRLLEDNSLNWRIYPIVAEYYKNSNRINKSIATLQNGLIFFPDDIELLYELGQYLEINNHPRMALETMQKVLKINRYHAEALNFVGYSLSQMNENLEQAEMMIKRAMALRPGEAYIIDSLGWVYFLSGQFDKALRWLSLAVMLEPYEPEILAHFAMALKKNGHEIKLEEILAQLSLMLSGNDDLQKNFRQDYPEIWELIENKS